MHLRKTFLWSMIASLGLAALLGIAALLLPRYGPGEDILLSTALFAVFSLIALMCATVQERRHAVVLSEELGRKSARSLLDNAGADL